MSSRAAIDDLLVRAAAEDAARANVAWAAARRRFLLAPHGDRERRERALKEAAQEALRAALALKRAEREAAS